MSEPTVIDASGLRERYALPVPETDGTKHDRGTVVVVGGATETPGAVLLAGLAALRVGAGRLSIATAAPNAAALAVAVPEAAVTPLPVTAEGGIARTGSEAARRPVGEADAVLVGPGMTGPEETLAFVTEVLEALPRNAVIVLDALALTCGIVETDLFARCASSAVITPNSAEVEHLLGSGSPVRDEDAAKMLSDRLHVVTVSGSTIASPDGGCWRIPKGNGGLATSGSGDVLAGIVAGLAARGADPLRAGLWAVTSHSSAGDRLAHRIGPLGFLARELLDELPGILRES